MTICSTEILVNQPLPPVESPCINPCTPDGDDICDGCFRGIDEICARGDAADEQRRVIRHAVAGRGNGNGGRE
ncbi:MAG: DUF1289 domain-containing protein [Gammaproteobacteria bacterium]|nr:DUF1289 domain-containing protein [Gammaproteobacteria bacterium]